MTNRVVLGELPGGGMGLRVSRPGYNVLSTSLTPKQLSFDSRWPAAMRLVKSGVTGPGTSTVMFGETLPVEPLCFLLRKNSFTGLYNTDVGAEVRKDRIITYGGGDAYYVLTP